MATQKIYELGDAPPLGAVPEEMYAQLIRPERFGEPTKAFQVEKVPVPEIEPGRGAGLRDGGRHQLQQRLGRARRRRSTSSAHAAASGDTTGFHIGGSDASGIVYAVGSDVHERQGRRRGRHPLRRLGRERPGRARRASDPMFAPSFKIWGYETNWGSFAQFTQGAGAPVPAEAEAPHLGGGRGLHAGRRDRVPHADGLAAAHGRSRTTSCWSGAAPAASAAMAIQIAKALGGDPGRRRLGRGEARVLHASSAPRATSTARSSTTGACCRTGRTPRRTTSGLQGARAFGKAIWDVARRAHAARASSSSTPARTPCRPRSSSATPAAWS